VFDVLQMNYTGAFNLLHLIPTFALPSLQLFCFIVSMCFADLEIKRYNLIH